LKTLKKLYAFLVMTAVLVVPSVVYADEGGPGSRLREIMQDEVGELFFIAVGLIALALAWRRAFAALIGFGVLAMLVAVFIWAPELLRDVGVNITETLFDSWRD
jgi:hypothetical protein